MPHLAKIMSPHPRRDLASNQEHESEDPAAAHRDLQAALQAAQDAGIDPLLISQLVRISIERQVLDQLEPDPENAHTRTTHVLVDGVGRTACAAESGDAGPD